MRKILLPLMLGLMLTGGASADMQVAERHVPEPQLVGKARLKVLFWKVYDAELYAPGGEWSADSPYALTLNYLRKLNGEQIAKRTISEIRDQGFADELALARWYEQMRAIIPDVDKKTRITGVYDDNGHTLFYRNGEPIGTIKDAEFSRNFFNIWLGEKSSEPKMRDRLLGEAE